MQSCVVSVRIFVLPVPLVAAHLVDAEFRFPAQFFERLGGIGIALGDVAGTAGADLVRELFAARLFKAADHVQHAVPDARAEVIDMYARLFAAFDGGDGREWPLRSERLQKLVERRGALGDIAG